jgi:hypothetical protein
MKRITFCISFLIISVFSFAQAGAGEYDLSLNEKRLNIIPKLNLGRFNKILPFTNGSVEFLYAFGLKSQARLELGIGKTSFMELGGVFDYKNQIVNQAKEIYKEEDRSKKYNTLDDEIVSYVNKHKIRGIRIGAYGYNTKITPFIIDELGYSQSTISKSDIVTDIENVQGLPTFRFQNLGAYLGWSIYNSVNYTNANHQTGLTAAGRHNDYFTINIDALFGTTDLKLSPNSLSNGYSLVNVHNKYSKSPLGARLITEIGIKNVKQVLSFHTNLELAKYPNHQNLSYILGLGLRVSLLDDIIRN